MEVAGTGRDVVIGEEITWTLGHAQLDTSRPAALGWADSEAPSPVRFQSTASHGPSCPCEWVISYESNRSSRRFSHRSQPERIKVSFAGPLGSSHCSRSARVEVISRGRTRAVRVADSGSHEPASSGRPVDDDLIEQLAREAEDGYDVNEIVSRPGTRGRPRLRHRAVNGRIRASRPRTQSAAHTTAQRSRRRCRVRSDPGGASTSPRIELSTAPPSGRRAHVDMASDH